MHQPIEPFPQYPAGAPAAELPRPPVPPQVKRAVKAMYAGAAASVVGIAIDIATVGATKTAIEKNSRHHLTASQLNASGHVLAIGFAAGGLIAVLVWIVLARACQHGSNWARITGTVLFAIATVDTVVGLHAPLAGAVRAWAPVSWLAGLVAVIFLWQGASTAFFKGQP
jgi:hypothetical protein